MSLWGRLRRPTCWTTAIYQSETPLLSLGGQLLRTFGAPRLLRRPLAPHTQADPFLIVHDDRLYLFLEVVRGNRAGVIEAWSSGDLADWTSHGTVLRTPTHLSYPNVLAIDGALYLLPESKAAGGVTLYQFDRFPHRVRPVRRLLDGAFNDPTPFYHDGCWYLFVTSAVGLELYVTENLLTAPLRRHPVGVIERDARLARCGGPIVSHEGMLYRPAQDGRLHYGAGLDLREIVTLTPTAYVERPRRVSILSRDETWNRAGGHHLAGVNFRGATVYAIDGQRRDPFHHKLTGKIAILLDLLRSANRFPASNG